MVLSGSNMGTSNSLWNIILTSVLSESVLVRLRKMTHSSLLLFFCATCYSYNANTRLVQYTQDQNCMLSIAVHVTQLTTESTPPTLTPLHHYSCSPSPNLLKER